MMNQMDKHDSSHAITVALSSLLISVTRLFQAKRFLSSGVSDHKVRFLYRSNYLFLLSFVRADEEG